MSELTERHNIVKRGNVHILGTRHGSERSMNETEEVIREVDPEFVVVEVSPKRLKLIQTDSRLASWWDQFRIFISNPRMYIHFRKNQSSDYKNDLGVAIDIAEDIGAEIVAGDEDMAANFSSISSGDRSYSSESEKEKAKQGFKEEFGEEFMEVKKSTFEYNPEYTHGIHKYGLPDDTFDVLIKNRNETMASNVREVAESNPDSEIVFVSGYSHTYGVSQRLSDLEE